MDSHGLAFSPNPGAGSKAGLHSACKPPDGVVVSRIMPLGASMPRIGRSMFSCPRGVHASVLFGLALFALASTLPVPSEANHAQDILVRGPGILSVPFLMLGKQYNYTDAFRACASVRQLNGPGVMLPASYVVKAIHTMIIMTPQLAQAVGLQFSTVSWAVHLYSKLTFQQEVLFTSQPTNCLVLAYRLSAGHHGTGPKTAYVGWLGL